MKALAGIALWISAVIVAGIFGVFDAPSSAQQLASGTIPAEEMKEVKKEEAKKAEEAKKTEKAEKATPTFRTIAIPANAIEVFTEAQKRTAEGRKAVETSPVWKDYLILQNQEQTALVYAMAEAGLKPSEGCRPVIKEGTLTAFECPDKPVKPAK